MVCQRTVVVCQCTVVVCQCTGGVSVHSSGCLSMLLSDRLADVVESLQADQVGGMHVHQAAAAPAGQLLVHKLAQLG